VVWVSFHIEACRDDLLDREVAVSNHRIEIQRPLRGIPRVVQAEPFEVCGLELVRENAPRPLPESSAGQAGSQ
jgi:hypothetical protein